MERIWAPWRGPYVRSIGRVKGCFLCAAVKGRSDRKSLVVWRRSSVFVVLNRYPFAGGHLMVCPYRHEGRLEGLTDAEAGEMMSTARIATGALERAFRARGFNLGMNVGQAGGAGLSGHLHMHVVPRWPGDTNFMPVLAGTRVISQSLDAQWKLLTERFNGCRSR